MGGFKPPFVRLFLTKLIAIHPKFFGKPTNQNGFTKKLEKLNL
jgi:hypothetical protein